ncbi:hypothetical protein E2C01_005360 [Portunus trituberculatus]|uniref:Uncharacterized protein n=1 Tax=Portunus trituberculatus TaxID=210409 RepID=A0A5B7CSB5_PORTR|nr:hypothetical protein [Portunus trituberculatus]
MLLFVGDDSLTWEPVVEGISQIISLQTAVTLTSCGASCGEQHWGDSVAGQETLCKGTNSLPD